MQGFGRDGFRDGPIFLHTARRCGLEQVVEPGQHDDPGARIGLQCIAQRAKLHRELRFRNPAVAPSDTQFNSNSMSVSVSQQQGLHSRGYLGGLLTGQEKRIQRFHELLNDMIEN